jgi:hypothetical protein
MATTPGTQSTAHSSLHPDAALRSICAGARGRNVRRRSGRLVPNTVCPISLLPRIAVTPSRDYARVHCLLDRDLAVVSRANIGAIRGCMSLTVLDASERFLLEVQVSDGRSASGQIPSFGLPCFPGSFPCLATEMHAHVAPRTGQFAREQRDPIYRAQATFAVFFRANREDRDEFAADSLHRQYSAV